MTTAYVMFLDADAELRPDAFERLAMNWTSILKQRHVFKFLLGRQTVSCGLGPPRNY